MTKESIVLPMLCTLLCSASWGYVFMQEHDRRVSVVEELRVARAAYAERQRAVPVCPEPAPSPPSELWDAAYHEGFKRGSAFLEARHLQESVADCSRLLAECRNPAETP
jgi:hypothetical protein